MRAAWESVAEFIGKAISIEEDIESNEIAVGKRFIAQKDARGNPLGAWALYVTDNLDNGRGIRFRVQIAGTIRIAPRHRIRNNRHVILEFQPRGTAARRAASTASGTTVIE